MFTSCWRISVSWKKKSYQWVRKVKKKSIFSLILKIKGIIKYDNGCKWFGFMALLWHWGFCEDRLFKVDFENPVLCQSLSFFCSPSFLSYSLFFSFPLHTSFVQKCLLYKLTVLWCVISKRHSMLMLNLFCIQLLWGRPSTLPLWSSSLPSSSRLRAYIWSLFIYCWKHICPSFCPLVPRHPLFFSS